MNGRPRAARRGSVHRQYLFDVPSQNLQGNGFVDDREQVEIRQVGVAHGVGIARHQDHLGKQGAGVLDVPGDVDTAEAGHLDIDEDDLWLDLLDQTDGGEPVQGARMAHAQKIEKIAERLDISDATADPRCTTCHGTQQKAGNLKAVSCESCHGAAGGESGWLEVHNFFGVGLDPKDKASREKELEADYHKRLADCDRLGMRRSENLYALAKNCFECHTVPNETLVNAGQHPTETKAFEMVEFFQGEVRHNFQLNQAENAAAPTLWTDARFATDDRTAAGRRSLMYVVGQLAACEVSLRSRATATGRGKFLTATNKRILDIKGNLEDIHEEAAIKEVQDVLDALEPLKRSSLRKVTDQDPTTFGDLAKLAAQAGQQVASSYNGNDWGNVKVPKKTKGKAYQP